MRYLIFWSHLQRREGYCDKLLIETRRTNKENLLTLSDTVKYLTPNFLTFLHISIESGYF